MKRGYSKLSICDTNTRYSAAELKRRGDPNGTPAPVDIDSLLQIASGKYQLVETAPDGNRSLQQVIVQ